MDQRCHQFKLHTIREAQSVARLTAAGHGEALPTFLEELEQEPDDRRQRRIDRLAQACPGCPRPRLGKPSSTTGCPCPCGSNWTSWPTATFPNRESNVMAFGLPRHLARPTPCARKATAWSQAGHSVLFAPAYSLVAGRTRTPSANWLLLGRLQSAHPGQLRLTAQARSALPCSAGCRAVRASFSPSWPNATKLRSLGIGSNLVFSEWERIFANPMDTAAANDRVVHHSVSAGV